MRVGNDADFTVFCERAYSEMLLRTLSDAGTVVRPGRLLKFLQRGQARRFRKGLSTTFDVAAVQQLEQRICLTGVPNLLAPAASIMETQPAFEWSAVADADHYDLWVNNQTTGQVGVIRNQNVVGTTFTPGAALTAGHSYVWTVRAFDGSGTPGEWATHRTFSIAANLGVPTPSAPSGSTSDLKPTFQWSAVGGASRYDLWVNNQTTGQSGIIRNTNVTATSFTATADLTVGHSYIWTVRALDDSGNAGEWAGHRTFSVTAALGVPTPTAPVSSTSLLKPVFQWSSVTGADHYDLWVNNQTTGQSGVIRNQNVSTNTFTPTTDLVVGHTYIWTVRALDSGNNPGDWAAHRTFEVVPAIGVSTPNTPAGPVSSVRPMFQWSAATGAARYDLWVNNQTTGQSGVIRNQNVTTNSFTPTVDLIVGHSYIWTVRAFDSNDNAGDWADYRTFNIVPSVGVPTLTAPLNTVSSTLPTFQWSAAAGAARYDLWVNDQTTGQSGVIRNMNVAGTSFTPTTPLDLNHSYIWTVRAFDASSNAGEWSNYGTFTIEIPLAVPVSNGPTGTVGDLTPTFQWLPIESADRYDLWVNNQTTGQSGVIRRTNLTEPRFTPLTPLVAGHSYLWTVRAFDASGRASEWSTHKTFTATTPAPVAPALQVELLKDINTQSYLLDRTVAIGNTIYFATLDPQTGAELWKSDGTADGTKIVKDIYPGPRGADPEFLINVNGTLFFTASDPVFGRELWKSDGTAAGTVIVKDIDPSNFPQDQGGGPKGGIPSQLTNVNGTLFFSAISSETLGIELWKSDGTAAGTVMVKDIRQGGYGIDASSHPDNLANINGTLYFTANDGTTSNNRELWKSNGTSAGTVKVVEREMDLDQFTADDLQFTELDGKLYFLAKEADTEVLMRTDGTAGGTVVVQGLTDTLSQPRDMVKIGSQLFFSARTDGIFGRQLWKTDGTAAGTVMVKSFGPVIDGFYSGPDALTNLNGTLLFTVGGDPASGRELWKSDGTAAGTVLVKDILPGPDWSVAPENLNLKNTMTAAGSYVYFNATNGKNGFEVWRSDGTTAGTSMVKDIAPGPTSSAPQAIRALANNQVSFFAADGSGGVHVWKSDGTATGTIRVADIPVNSVYSNPQNLTDINGTVFFTANDGAVGKELWKTDGTAEGTVLVTDLQLGVSGSYPENLTRVGNALFFTANADDGPELWKTDGTEAGTVSLGVFDGARELTPVNDSLFFIFGRQLIKSDGTLAGTTVVKEFSASFSTRPELTNVNGTLFFRATDDYSNVGEELWKSDGTSQGTVLVKDIIPGRYSAFPYFANFTALNGLLLFRADDGQIGTELWKSDGTAAGTKVVKDIYPGLHPNYGWPLESRPSELSKVGNQVYFTATDSEDFVTKLYKTDGTTAGTVKVADAPGSGIRGLIDVNGTAFFEGDNDQLWKTDGTTAGTVMVKDVYVSNDTSRPIYSQLTSINGTVYFSAWNPTDGRELWRSDGTTAGTWMFRDLFPGGLSIFGNDYTNDSNPLEITSLDGTLLFTADDGINNAQIHGRELWIGRTTPEAPVIAGPVTTSLSKRPTFTWSEVKGAQRYDLWVNDLTTGQSQIIREQNLTGTSFTPTTDLMIGRSYVWTVRAITATGIASDWAPNTTFSVAQVATNTFSATGLPKAIRDFQTTTSTLNVAGVGAILDVDVALDITHTYDSDVHVELVSPDGTTIVLFGDLGPNQHNFTDTVLDDEAAGSIELATAPFTGRFQPMSPLSLFDGLNADGTWTLRVYDDGPGDVGTLNRWSLTIVAEVVAGAASQSLATPSPTAMTSAASSLAVSSATASALQASALSVSSFAVPPGNLSTFVAVDARPTPFSSAAAIFAVSQRPASVATFGTVSGWRPPTIVAGRVTDRIHAARLAQMLRGGDVAPDHRLDEVLPESDGEPNSLESEAGLQIVDLRVRDFGWNSDNIQDANANDLVLAQWSEVEWWRE